MASGSAAIGGLQNHASSRRISCQASAEHSQQCAEFPLLRNRGLGPLGVTILPIPLVGRGTATFCAAVQSTAPFFVAGNRQGLPLLVRAPH